MDAELSTSLSAAFAGAAADDVSEDSCSICLEPFAPHDPSTITTCKHEYHLQCILEWSQRSKECPICWRILTLKDSSSQELLDAVGKERSARCRISTASSEYLTDPREGLGIGQDVPLDLDFDESIIMQHVAAMLGRNCDVRPRETGTSNGLGQSGSSAIRSRVNVSQLQRSYEATGEETHDLPVPSTDGGLVTPEMPICFSMQPPSPVPPSSVQHPQVTERSHSPENSSFSESLKSKFSSASARYKESISKGTRSLKERILARNSVKELSKGVQREMSTGFARLIERLDLNKQAGTSVSIQNSDDATVKSPIKGKGAQVDATRHEIASADLHDLGTIPGRLEVVPSQGGK